ncbi:MAG: nucleotidyltransferase family protein [Proteiniphilum sp.]|jgi:NDP-sugar pyrophosphorylase family protein|nr:nucleotidyltransferase family protein [Proteiniphilum sp.]
MKAMIFAAGLGTRLKPLTATMPKALVPVGGKPLLEHVIVRLKAAGFDEIIINVHHFAGQIVRFVEERGCFDIHVEFSDEREMLLDTGGGLRKAAPFFDDDRPFAVHNVDILSNVDLRKLCEEHVRCNSPAALLVCSERKTSRYLLFDGDRRLRGWVNEDTGEVKSPFPHFDPRCCRKLAFAGIQLLHPSVFRYMAGFPDRFSIVDFYLSVCDRVDLLCYRPDDLLLLDVGKTEALRRASRFPDGFAR